MKDGGILVASYLLSRLVAMLQISEPDSLIPAADQIDTSMHARFPNLRIITMGHTHDPEQRKLSSGRWYYNTGTWIPVIEASSTAIREDRTYVVLHLANKNGHIEPRSLRRWNDDAMREDELVLVVPGNEVAESIVHPSFLQRVSKRARWFFASK